MNFEKCYPFCKNLFVIIPLFIAFSSFAQTNSIKELKKNVQTLNEKRLSIKPGDPWTIEHIITPEELSSELKNNNSRKPIIYHVGFDFLFKQLHIPGSIYLGPASRQTGLDKIKSEVNGIKHDQDIVIYCGCCPWKDCPNIRQAYQTFKDLGFTNVKVLYIPDTFAKDWKDKGFAVEK